MSSAAEDTSLLRIRGPTSSERPSVVEDFLQNRQKPLPARRSAYMSPIEKMRNGRFPCKLLLAIVNIVLLVILLAACQVPRWVDDMSQRLWMINNFGPSAMLPTISNYEQHPKDVLTSIALVRRALDKIHDRYFKLASTTSSFYMFYYVNTSGSPVPTDADILPLTMTATFADRSSRMSADNTFDVTRSVNMTKGKPYGFFATELPSTANTVNFRRACRPRKDMITGDYYLPCRSGKKIYNVAFDIVREMTVSMKVLSIIPYDPLSGGSALNEWNILFRFDFSSNGCVIETMETSSTTMRKAEKTTMYMGVAIALIITGTWAVALHARALYKVIRFRNHMRQRHGLAADESTSEDEDGAPIGKGEAELTQQSMKAIRWTLWKTDLRNNLGLGWTVASLATNALVVLYSTLMLAQVLVTRNGPALRYMTVIIGGLAAFFSCVMFVSYMRYWPRMYVMVSAAAMAMPHLGNFLVAVLPVFSAFAIFAVVAFGAYAPQYATFLEASTALYAAIFGDSLLQAFQVSGATNVPELRVVSILHSFGFISLFIWVVINVALAIVVDAYAFVDDMFEFFSDNSFKTPQENLWEHVRAAKHGLAELICMYQRQASTRRKVDGLQAPIEYPLKDLLPANGTFVAPPEPAHPHAGGEGRRLLHGSFSAVPRFDLDMLRHDAEFLDHGVAITHEALRRSASHNPRVDDDE